MIRQTCFHILGRPACSRGRAVAVRGTARDVPGGQRLSWRHASQRSMFWQHLTEEPKHRKSFNCVTVLRAATTHLQGTIYKWPLPCFGLDLDLLERIHLPAPELA